MSSIPLALATAATFACALTAPGVAVAGNAAPAQAHAATTTGSAHKLPEGWRRCNNAYHRFSIGYPRLWHTTQLRAADKCRQFDREPFTVPEASEYPITALNAVATTAVFSELVQTPNNPEFEERLLWQPTWVGGRGALRFETVSTGGACTRRAPAPTGTRSTGTARRSWCSR